VLLDIVELCGFCMQMLAQREDARDEMLCLAITTAEEFGEARVVGCRGLDA